MSRHIGFLVYPSFDLLDLSGPLEAFQWAEYGNPGSYRTSVMSIDGGPVASAAGLTVITEPVVRDPLDSLIIVGGGAVPGPIAPDLIDYVRSASLGARRTASVCTGAFLLAATGLLDGRTATTHWQWAAKLQAQYPSLRVDGDRIYINDSGIWTSAGITAGIDMSLALIEEDLGKEVARSIARTLVVYYRRPGGQLQYSSLLEHEPDADRIRHALSFAREHLADPLPVEKLADVANLSVRQFGRAFLAATGITPAKAVDRLRAEAARPRVEDGRESLEVIAREVGFTDPNRMRQSFIRVFGYPPQAIRRSARAADRQK
ncbi:MULTISPECIES: GlxA family transcriptional regulator [unclassified Sphingobium]|uniref:GlxA family transcriptional regulator n=1 Tax=unclassified Sphingobium TaxID=2611147 RepID=UPI00214CD252|nr:MULTISPECIES: GlxA family transcriptional regulator [unclassified Sphingobium]